MSWSKDTALSDTFSEVVARVDSWTEAAELQHGVMLWPNGAAMTWPNGSFMYWPGVHDWDEDAAIV